MDYKKKARIKEQFKKFLIIKYIKKNITKEIVCDPTEKLTNFYCIHGKNTSELSQFVERLLKIELTDEYLFNELKEKLDEKNITADLLDVDLPVEDLKMRDLSDDMLIFLRNKLKNNLSEPYIASKLENEISKKMNVSPSKISQRRDSTLELTSNYLTFLKRRNRNYKHRKKRYPMWKVHQTNKGNSQIHLNAASHENHQGNYASKHSLIDSSTLSSDSAANNRLDKLHYYPTALDQFGNRVESYKLPGESVNRMLGRLSKALNRQNKSRVAHAHPEKVMENKLINKFKKLHTSDFVRGGDLLRKVEKQDSYGLRPVSVSDINSFAKIIKTLSDKKNQLKKYMSKEDYLISEVQKLDEDNYGWTKKMLLSLKLMREGNQQYYNELSKQIGDRILKENQKQERAKVKYWSLLNDDREKGRDGTNDIGQKKSDKIKDIYRKKENTYKTINEFMLSRDYREEDSRSTSEEEVDDGGSEVSYNSFKGHVLETLENVFAPEEAAAFKSFFDEPRGSSDLMSRVVKTSTSFDAFPVSPHIDEKQMYVSRLSQVRGAVVNKNELIEKPKENPYPFGSRTSRGLSPIKKIKCVNNIREKKTLLEEEDRKKFLFPPAKSLQKKRLCEQNVRQRYYNWEPVKKLGQQILPGTDILIEAPQIKELRDIEDAWKYNIPPFDYMKCGLPQSSLEAVANEILQKELLHKEIMDIKREEQERKKEKREKSRASFKREREEDWNEKSTPAPWQYNVRRWPSESQTRVAACPSMVPSFISRVLNKYHHRDKKGMQCKAV